MSGRKRMDDSVCSSQADFADLTTMGVSVPSLVADIDDQSSIVYEAGQPYILVPSSAAQTTDLQIGQRPGDHIPISGVDHISTTISGVGHIPIRGVDHISSAISGVDVMISSSCLTPVANILTEMTASKTSLAGYESDEQDDDVMEHDEEGSDDQMELEDGPLSEILGTELTEKYLKGHMTFEQLTEALNLSTCPSSRNQSTGGTVKSADMDSDGDSDGEVAGFSGTVAAKFKQQSTQERHLQHGKDADDDSDDGAICDSRWLSLRKTKKRGANNQRDADEEAKFGHSRRSFGTGQRKLPDELAALLGQANMAFAAGNKADAIRMCEEVVRQRPNFPDAYLSLAAFYDDLNEPAKHYQCALLAAHLRPNLPASDWLHLAELSLANGKQPQAISCLNQGIQYNPGDAELYERKAELHRQRGEDKKVLATYVKAVRGLLKTEPGDRYIDFSRDIAKQCYASGDVDSAIACMHCCLKKAKMENSMLYEELHYLMEMLMSKLEYKQSVEAVLTYAALCFDRADGKVLNKFSLLANAEIRSCDYPEDFPVDIRVKTVICLLYLGLLNVAKPMLSELESDQSFEEDGDLFFDVAEALANNSYYSDAKRLLAALTQTTQFNMAAVWLLYAKVLEALGQLEPAVTAFQRVLELVPSHIDARLMLSDVLHKMGLDHEALKTLDAPLESEECDRDLTELMPTDERLLYQKAILLESKNDWPAFNTTAKQLLAMYFTEYHLDPEACTRPKARAFRCLSDVKNAAVARLGSAYQKFVKASPQAKYDTLAFADVWQIFVKVCSFLMSEHRNAEFFNIAGYAAVCPFFLVNGRSCEVERILMAAAIRAREVRVLWALVRFAFHDEKDPKIWNLYALVFSLSFDEQVRNFTKALIRDGVCRHEECIPLAVLIGNVSLMNGSYQHALLEYLNVFAHQKDNPLISLLLGVTYCAMACKKDMARRHDICLQGLAFMSRYEQLRGPCQEVFYNLGRVCQQLGLAFVAVHYYKKALALPCAIPGQTKMYDLKRETAHNLALIYQHSGNVDLARNIYQQYCVI